LSDFPAIFYDLFILTGYGGMICARVRVAVPDMVQKPGILNFNDLSGFPISGIGGSPGFKFVPEAFYYAGGEIGFSMEGQVPLLIVPGPLCVDVIFNKAMNIFSAHNVFRGAGDFKDPAHF
jgi:hypothetical protein